MHYIAPSILAANFLNLEKDITLINESEADYIHVDVMDGVFVPNISFGQNIVKMVNGIAKKPLDVHLMIVNPDQYIDSFVDCGADILSVHYEACPHLHRTVNAIREKGIKSGVAINPHTSINLLEDVLESIDQVILMSVNPGFGGQKFIYQTLNKIKELKSRIVQRNLDIKIEIDGGVGLQNAEAILGAGADILVAGSSVFKSKDPKQTIASLKGISPNTFI